VNSPLKLVNSSPAFYRRRGYCRCQRRLWKAHAQPAIADRPCGV